MPLVDSQGLTEAQFLARYDASKYDRPSVTADAVLFTLSEDAPPDYRRLPTQKLSVLLVKRGGHPFLGKWALPGGFTEPSETLEQTVQRELFEETGIHGVYSEQLHTFSGPERDPRGSTVTCAYLALADRTRLKPQAGDDAAEVAWFNVLFSDDGRGSYGLTLQSDEVVLQARLQARQGAFSGSVTQKAAQSAAVPDAISITETSRHAPLSAAEQNSLVPPLTLASDLAFDHAEILTLALLRLRHKAAATDIVFNLLPDSFTLAQLQQAFELLLGRSLLAPAFRRRMASVVEATETFAQHAGHRPARLYRRRA